MCQTTAPLTKKSSHLLWNAFSQWLLLGRGESVMPHYIWQSNPMLIISAEKAKERKRCLTFITTFFLFVLFSMSPEFILFFFFWICQGFSLYAALQGLTQVPLFEGQKWYNSFFNFRSSELAFGASRDIQALYWEPLKSGPLKKKFFKEGWHTFLTPWLEILPIMNN